MAHGDANLFGEGQNAIHDAAARERFPGPDYYAVLGWLHEELKPASYVEIGVSFGESLKLAQPPTISLGIDPKSLANHAWKTPTRIARLSSREFFASQDLSQWLCMPVFSLAFIDGQHLFEEAVADLTALEPYAGPESLVVVHDTIPLDRETASRRRRTMFHTGDVWKILPYLRMQRPLLDVVTIPTAPTGLTLIRGFRGGAALPSGSTTEFIMLPYEYYESRHSEFLITVPNERNRVAAWLRAPYGFRQNTPVQSIPTRGA